MILGILTFCLVSTGWLQGCGTLLSLEYQEEYANTVYSGVRLDANLLSGKEPRDGFSRFLVMLDMPLSVVGDTLMLFTTIPETRRNAKTVEEIDQKMLTDIEEIYEVFSLFQGGMLEIYPGSQHHLNIGLSLSVSRTIERTPLMMRLSVASNILWTLPLEEPTIPGEYLDVDDLSTSKIQLHTVTRQHDALLLRCTITMRERPPQGKQVRIQTENACVSTPDGDILSRDQIRKLFQQ